MEGRMPEPIQKRAGGLRGVRFDFRGLPDRLSDGRAWGRILLIGWLAFLVAPVAEFARTEGASPANVVLVAAAVAALLAGFVWSLPGGFEGQVGRRSLVLPMIALTAGVILTLGIGWYWDTVFLFAAIAAGRLRPAGRGAAMVLLVAIGAGVTTTAGALADTLPPGTNFGSGLNFVLNTLLVGLVAVSIFSMLINIAELRAARAEIARLAVAEERARIARDLHDLLGHTLSLIALKSELAGRLLPENPDRAGDEIADIEAVARESLREVREAVSGYRQATLAAELAGARVMLEAAGIACDVTRESAIFPESADEPLGWAVREGVTNVIRHSRAGRCWIRTRREGGEFGVEILDDGRGADPLGAVDEAGENGSRSASRGGGNGLAGLAERASAVGGRLETGRRPEGGFRLAVWLPTEPETSPATGAGSDRCDERATVTA
jgi:two-component system, NarL family, sensor histidine kinase DesK